MGDHPDDATAALRHVRLRLGTAEDGLDRAIVGLHHIGHLPADWRAEFESDLGIPRHQIDTFRTLLNGR
jgi:hypothetical protein